MNNRERFHAIMNYQCYDRLPVVHFSYWTDTLDKWCAQGHITAQERAGISDGSPEETAVSARLGFDFNYYNTYQDLSGFSSLFPAFEEQIVEERPDGSQVVRNSDGALVINRPDAGSIHAEVGHTLVDRKSWEEHYLPRLQYTQTRFDDAALKRIAEQSANRDYPLGLYCKSLLGQVRNWLGVVNLSYLYIDDEPLFREIIDTVGTLCYQVTERVLKSGARFDFGHFWEDICFKNGPLIAPGVFREYAGPHYGRICGLLNAHGISIVSLDCDGWIDALIPVWLDNGVNTMFPIEVGTWGGSIGPWREKYGRVIRGVGGMDKRVFAHDYAAVDQEIERLRPLVELGGFIPCPDHRIAPDAKWENVQYYCDRMRKVFGG